MIQPRPLPSAALRLLRPLLLGALAAGLAGAARAERTTPRKFDRVEGLLKDAVAKKRVAGATALVSRRGKVLYESAVGWQDAEAKKPMKTSTIFRIASMTKPVTSVAAMMLCAEGKLRLSDPVSKYIPEFRHMSVLGPGRGKEREPARREVTVRDLLTHTSGISYRFFNRPRLGRLYSRADVIDGLVETP